jgi:hypothetical protein
VGRDTFAIGVRERSQKRDLNHQGTKGTERARHQQSIRMSALRVGLCLMLLDFGEAQSSRALAVNNGQLLAGGKRIPAGDEKRIPAGDGDPFSL